MIADEIRLPVEMFSLEQPEHLYILYLTMTRFLSLYPPSQLLWLYKKVNCTKKSNLNPDFLSTHKKTVDKYYFSDKYFNNEILINELMCAGTFESC